MSKVIEQPVPTTVQLIRATVIALLVAAVILVIAVLPAEYGIDPTGIGSGLGLVELNNDDAQSGITLTDAATAPAAPGKAVVTRVAGAFRIEERSIVLSAYEGVELKAVMDTGQSFVFSWATDSSDLYVDMHGEPHGATDGEFTSYWKEKQQSSGQGTFTAQFDGTHGWYWQNMSEKDVTITVQISGFYKDIYQPE